MRVLALHCDYVQYEPITKEIRIAEDAEKKPVRIEEVLLLLTAVETNDNDDTLLKIVSEINRIAKEVGAKRVLIYPYAHLSTELKRPLEALHMIKKLQQALSAHIEVHRAPFGWNKALEIKVKGHPLAERLITA